MNVQIKVARKDGAWSVFRRLDDWGPVEIAYNCSRLDDAQAFAWQCAQAYADQEHEVTVTIDARG
tara:strand:- start:188 stop:382 length:195 start_codon:yes stop_codon:yes gene_type:complete